MNKECLFCQIINSKIPCYKIYENDIVLAFLDISPCSKGHTLVIPKKHYDTYLDMEPNDSCEYFKYVNIISKLLKNKLKCDGLSLCINIGSSAGQEIMHQHVHLIPRWKNIPITFEKIHLNDNYFEEIKNLVI